MAEFKEEPERERVEPVPCIVCGRELESVMKSFPMQNQPYGATVFSAHGQYGSTAWDPVSIRSGPSLEINVCDPCLIERQDRVLIVTPHPTPVEYTYLPWSEATSEDQRPPESVTPPPAFGPTGVTGPPE